MKSKLINSINSTYSKYRKQVKLKYKENQAQFLKDSILFILFYLLNAFTPLIITIISSYVNMIGSSLVISLGNISFIQISFIQLSWSICLVSIYAYNKSIQNKLEGSSLLYDVIAVTIPLSFLYAFIFTPIFIIGSISYNLLANNYYFLTEAVNQATQYIFTISIYIFLSGFINSSIILIQKFKSNILAIFLLILFHIVSISLSCFLVFFVDPKISINLQGVFIGISYSISSLILSIIVAIIICKISSFGYRNFFRRKRIGYFLKNTFLPLIPIISHQIFKIIAFIIIWLAFSNGGNKITYREQQLVLIVWYNIIFVSSFLLLGLSDAILYFGFNKYRKNIKLINKNLITTCTIFFLIQFLILILAFFGIKPLVSLYLLNNTDWINSYTGLNLGATFTEQLLIPEFYNKVIALDNIKLIQILNNYNVKNPDLVSTQMSQIIDSIRNSYPNKYLTKYILNEIQKLNLINEFQMVLTHILNTTSVDNVFKYFNNPSATFVFLGIWVMLFGVSQTLYSSSVILKGSFRNWNETLIILFVQAITISFMFSFGLELKEFTNYNSFDAWSIPLLILGIISFVYYLVNYIQIVKISHRRPVLIH